MDFYKYSPIMAEVFLAGIKADGFREVYSNVLNRTRRNGYYTEKMGAQAFVKEGTTGGVSAAAYIYWHPEKCRVAVEKTTSYRSSVFESNPGSVELATDWPEVLAIINRAPALIDPGYALLPVFDITKPVYSGSWADGKTYLDASVLAGCQQAFRFTKVTEGDLILDYRCNAISNGSPYPSTGGVFWIESSGGTVYTSVKESYSETPEEFYKEKRSFSALPAGDYRLFVRSGDTIPAPNGDYIIYIDCAEVIPEITLDTSADPSVEISSGNWVESADGYTFPTSDVESAKFTRTDTRNPPLSYWDFYSLFDNFFFFQEIGADLLAATDIRLQIKCDYGSSEATARVNIYVATDIYAGLPATEAEYSARALSVTSVEWDMSAPWVLDGVYSSPNIRSLIPADWTSGKNLFIVVKPVEFAENNYKEYKAKTAGQADAPRLVIS